MRWGDPNKEANIERWQEYCDGTTSRNNGGDYVDSSTGQTVDRGRSVWPSYPVEKAAHVAGAIWQVLDTPIGDWFKK